MVRATRWCQVLHDRIWLVQPELFFDILKGT